MVAIPVIIVVPLTSKDDFGPVLPIPTPVDVTLAFSLLLNSPPTKKERYLSLAAPIENAPFEA